jgi:cell division protein FtsN
MNQNGGSKADTMVKLALVFFISLFAFSVGTFVGKNVSDSDRRNAELYQEESKVRDLASIDPRALDVEPSNALTEHEVASLEKEFIHEAEKAKAHDRVDNHGNNNSRDTLKDEHRNVASNTGHDKKENSKNDFSEASDADGYKKLTRKIVKTDHKNNKNAHKITSKQHVKTIADKRAAHKNDKTSNVAKRVANHKAPSKDRKRKPNSIAKNLPIVPKSSVGKYTVQVSAYTTKREAKSHEKNLDTQGYESFIIKVKIKGKTWYRVNIGAFHSLKNAKNFKTTFLKDNSNQAAIVKKIIR